MSEENEKMARRTSTPSEQTGSRQLSPAQIERGISRLRQRIDDLQSFDIGRVRDGTTPDLSALEVSISDTLERCFGAGTAATKKFLGAAVLNFRPTVVSSNYPQHSHYVDGARKNIEKAVALLEAAVAVLQEDLADALENETVAPAEAPSPAAFSEDIFVVHGHDEGAREAVARFLDTVGLNPIILHEQANQGRTVIEKIVAHGHVGFAVVLLTPDDMGCVKGGQPVPRVRQNVLLELGYFIGKLGRDKVCALKRGEVDIPSDFAGVIWESMDASGGWKLALGRELQAAGFAIDWNKVLGKQR